jgi:hypothetical protein
LLSDPSPSSMSHEDLLILLKQFPGSAGDYQQLRSIIRWYLREK